jgi:hypothetical protein
LNSKLTDEELISLALQEDNKSEPLEQFDVKYYTQRHNIVDGKDKIYTKHLYLHYKKWSIDPLTLRIFHDTLEVKRKFKQTIFIDKKQCTIDLDKLIGEYVRSEKKRKKEERLRQIRSTQSKA